MKRAVHEVLLIMLSGTMLGLVLQVEGFYCPFVTEIQTTLQSPGELRVCDSIGRVTGLIDAGVVNEIPKSSYSDNTVTLSFPMDSYLYDVVGTEEGLYSLTVTAMTKKGEIIMTAKNIQILPSEVHRYAIDWIALSEAEQGVTVATDSDGDGEFEGNLTLATIVSVDGVVLPIRTADLNGDRIVSILDTAIVAVAYGTKPSDLKWNALADIDNNGVVNILDVFVVAKECGKAV